MRYAVTLESLSAAAPDYNQATKERIASLEAEVMPLEGILTALAAKAQTGNVTADDVMAHAGRWLLQSRKSP